ncbi:MAG: MFS transporter [Candidatus Izimaplasma sp.]|nr:MFS transporter [Candidatus Izimaplasma bacterium]
MGKFVLKNRDYLLLFLGGVVSNLGTHMYNFAISLYVLSLTGKPTIQGLYLATGGLVYFSVSIFAGAIVDHLDKVKVVYYTDLVAGISVLMATFIVFSNYSLTATLITLFIISAALGVSSALFNPAASSLPAHILEEDQMQQNSSLQHGMFALYGIFGVLLGGTLYELLEIEIIMLFNAVSFLLSSFSEYFIKTKTFPEKIKLSFKNTMIKVKEGLIYIYKLKPILYLVIFGSVLNFFTLPVIANGLPYLFEIKLQKSAIYLALINASFPIGIIITSIYLGSRIQAEKVSPLIIRGLKGMTVFFLPFVIAPYLLLNGYISFSWFMVMASLSIFIMGIFNGFINIPYNTAIMTTVDKKMLGRTFSVIAIISNGMTPIALALGGFVIEALGVMILFYMAFIAVLIITILASRNKHVNQL